MPCEKHHRRAIFPLTTIALETCPNTNLVVSLTVIDIRAKDQLDGTELTFDAEWI